MLRVLWGLVDNTWRRGKQHRNMFKLKHLQEKVGI